MAPSDFKLTQNELEEIKDDVAFKTRTTLTLKYVVKKLGNIGALDTEVALLKQHRTAQWYFIGLIVTGIFGAAFWIIRVGM